MLSRLGSRWKLPALEFSTETCFPLGLLPSGGPATPGLHLAEHLATTTAALLAKRDLLLQPAWLHCLHPHRGDS